VPLSTQSKRLKAQLLRAAVRENADVIDDRLPAPLRPSRRFLHIWGQRSWVLLFPIGLLLAWGSIANRSAAVESAPVRARVEDAARPGAIVAAPTDRVSPDPALLARPVAADVLALGVRRVVLDAGHGGDNLGTASASGVLEKTLTLDLATRVRKLLVKRGVHVVLTRTSDETLSLKDRAEIANGWRGDIFVSIHLNSLEPSSLRAIETFYLGPGERPEHDAIAAKENEHSGYSLADMRTLLDSIYADVRRGESKRLAESVQRRLVRRLRTIDPLMKDRGVKTAPFIVLVATEMPAILAEVSCLSNAEEARRLGTEAYRQTIAEALASGIQDFIEHKHPGEQNDGSQS
jgi:N-acetylmuramoyl-L-alanine amidase